MLNKYLGLVVSTVNITFPNIFFILSFKSTSFVWLFVWLSVSFSMSNSKSASRAYLVVFVIVPNSNLCKYLGSLLS